jgi:hypothetical protein
MCLLLLSFVIASKLPAMIQTGGIAPLFGAHV